MSSLVKKYLMSITGLILSGFVLGHMLGNLQIFMHPDEINAYANFLHNILPAEFLWGTRLFLLATIVIHIVAAVKLRAANKAARPNANCTEITLQASMASRYMIYSGVLILAFIIFHILHYTVQCIYPEFQNLRYILNGEAVMDVYAMMIYGFSSKFIYVPLAYIVSMVILGWHLSHGFSSMFQSIGLRNHIWREKLDKLAMLFAAIVFLGMSSIPAMVLLSEQEGFDVLPTKTILEQVENWDGESPITIEYPSDK